MLAEYDCKGVAREARGTPAMDQAAVAPPDDPTLLLLRQRQSRIRSSFRPSEVYICLQDKEVIAEAMRPLSREETEAGCRASRMERGQEDILADVCWG
jgi:hypothetical protein